MGLGDKARELAQAIQATREFMELRQAKLNIDKNRDLKTRIQEFKKREQELLSSMNPSKEAEIRAELSKIFDNLAKITEVSRFLRAEKDFNAMMANVYKVIGDSVDAGLK